MPATIRPAKPADLPRMTELLQAEARRREAADPAFWSLPGDARERVEGALRADLEAAGAPERRIWLLAEAVGRPVGLAQAMLLPVPPIYAAALGPPGLLLDDCFVTEAAPPGTAEALLAAAESALRAAGAESLLASCPVTSPWRAVCAGQGYAPITLYLRKAGFEDRPLAAGVRPATPDDVPGIVAASAGRRQILVDLHRFWTPHPEADTRFDAWMRHSLTLTDREMFVSGPPGDLRGYVIAQPLAPLLLPAAHELEATGVLDDFHDLDFADPAQAAPDAASASALLSAAEAVFARRGFKSALVVCPAAWHSKAAVLEARGYRPAKLWMLKA